MRQSLSLVAVVCLLLGSAHACNMENNYTCDWWLQDLTTVQATQIQKGPITDASEKANGHYLLAKAENSHAFMWSPVIPASGPNCLLSFSYIVSGGRGEHLFVELYRSCDLSRGGRAERKAVHYEMSKDSKTWKHEVYPVGERDTPFELALGVGPITDTSAFIALDDVKLVNCKPEHAQRPRPCHANEFQCDSGRCLPRDKVCDLQPDCPCHEDESESFCSLLPRPARETFTDCSLEDGTCGWYSVPVPARRRTRWTKQLHADTDSFVETTLEGSDGGDEDPGPAILRSHVLPAPQSHRSSCKSQFRLKMGNPSHKLQVEVIELEDSNHFPPTEAHESRDPNPSRANATENGGRANTTLSLSDKGLQSETERPRVRVVKTISNHSNWFKWQNESVSIGDIRSKYVIQFRAILSSEGPASGVAIDDITLSQDCFSPAVELGTCGSEGRYGPSEEQCRQHKFSTPPGVTVSKTGLYAWTVPSSGKYRIRAQGASGGTSAQTGHFRHKGGLAEGIVSLNKGEEVKILVGQSGIDGCSTRRAEAAYPACDVYVNDPYLDSTERLKQDRVGHGGGGGGSFVYVTRNEEAMEMLVVAGGGAGHKMKFLNEWYPEACGGCIPQGSGASGIRPFLNPAPGSGGGALAVQNKYHHKTMGQSLPEGGAGGEGCLTDYSADGGFGGGGGACSSPGAGGGYTGGSVLPDMYNSTGGSSYVTPRALATTLLPGVRGGSGLVQIWRVDEEESCACHKGWCRGEGEEARVFSCVCPPHLTLDQDGVACVQAAPKLKEGPMVAIIASVACISVIVAIVVFIPIRFPLCRKRMVMCMKRPGPKPRKKRTPRRLPLPPPVLVDNENYGIAGGYSMDHDLQEIPRKNLTLVRPIGRGAFGEVFYGLLANQGEGGEKLPVAVKVLSAVDSEQTPIDFLMEAMTVSMFQHPNIVKFLGVSFSENPRYLVLELLEGGDLVKFLRESRPGIMVTHGTARLSNRELLKLALDIAQGCQHLEQKHFIHRDIAARNCLLTTKGPGRIAKIADFGMSKDIYRSDYYRKSGRAMLPVKWMPPEAFLDGIFTSKTDVWSFGILLWEIFSLGHCPYPGLTNEEVMQLVTNGGRLRCPVKCPSHVYDLMTSCWSGLPQERPSFTHLTACLKKFMDDDSISGASPRNNPPSLPTQSPPSSPWSSPTPSRGVDSNRFPNGLLTSDYLEPVLPCVSQPDPLLGRRDAVRRGNEATRDVSSTGSDVTPASQEDGAMEVEAARRLGNVSIINETNDAECQEEDVLLESMTSANATVTSDTPLLFLGDQEAKYVRPSSSCKRSSSKGKPSTKWF